LETPGGTASVPPYAGYSENIGIMAIVVPEFKLVNAQWQLQVGLAKRNPTFSMKTTA
jgi:hypothetical protein